MQQVAPPTPHPGNGCYLDTTRSGCRDGHCYFYCLIPVYVSKVDSSRSSLVASLERGCSRPRGFGHVSPLCREKCLQNRQVTVLTVGKNILGTSSSLSPLGRVNPSIARAIRSTFCSKVRIKRGLLDDGVCYLWDAHLRFHQSIEAQGWSK